MVKLGLKEFLHRREVLSFYKECLRSMKKLPNDQRLQYRDHIKHEFLINAGDLVSYLSFDGREFSLLFTNQ